MAEDIKALIEKIQQEGIQKAEEKARAIEEEARLKAEQIIAQAKHEAKKVLEAAEASAEKIKISTESLLKQAGRDLLLSLRREIDELLSKLIHQSVATALTPQETGKLISEIIKGYSAKEKGSLIISLNKEELQKIEKSFTASLKEEITDKGILLTAEDGISSGFMISFDKNKSHFDFTDKALADYIGTYLKPKLAEILTQ
ncbi:MAG: hypothetical protein AB1481_04730 [Candidatus Omnitrophota bacterium]